MKLVITEHSLITPEDLGGEGYRKFCLLAELDAIPFGYGVLHCIEENDAKNHWTLVTTDVEYMRRLVSQPISEGFEIPISKFRIELGGWPDEWIKGR
jgi:hypothetical protein